MTDKHRNSDLVEFGVDEYAEAPKVKKPKAKKEETSEDKE